MEKIRRKADELIIRGKLAMMQKKDGVDQIIIMFIIIAVAAEVSPDFYMFLEQRHYFQTLKTRLQRLLISGSAEDRGIK